MTEEAMDAILLDDEKKKKKKDSPRERDSGSDSPEDTASPPHEKKKRGLGCFGKLALLVLICFAAVAATYFLMRSRSETRFSERLSELAESGTPVLLEDLPVLYEIPERSLNSTEDWNTVIKTIASRKYQDSIINIDLVALPNQPGWPPNRWDGYADAKRFISSQQTLLNNLQLATMEYARFEFDASSNIALSQRRLRFLNQGYDFLELACFVAAHEKDRETLANLLNACLGYHRCLQLHPSHQTEQLLLRQRSLMTLLSAVQDIEFTQKELSRFRHQITKNNMDLWQPATRFWNMQRTLRTAFFNEPAAFDASALGQSYAEEPEWEAFRKFQRQHRKYSPYAGDDGLKFLKYMDLVQNEFQGNPLKSVSKIMETEQTIADATPSGMDEFRFPTAHEMVPSVHELVELSGSVAAIQNVALAALAFDYKRIESDEPVLMDDPKRASKGFLAEEPLDLYTDFPLTVELKNNELTILSTGPNKADDKLTGDDIGIRLPREKWNFSERPTQEVD